MTDYIDKYRRRISRRGENAGQFYENNTIAYIESVFHESPTFRVLEVVSTEFPNITSIDARVLEVERMGTLREILFRPKQYLNIGTYVKFDNKTWIISDIWGDTRFTSRALAQKCNHKLRFALSENWLDGNGELDSSKVFEIYCLSSQSPLGSKAVQGKHDIPYNAYDVRLPSGQLFVYFEANEMTKNIEINNRLIFGNNVYEVYGIDDTSLTNEQGYGIIQLTIKLTTKQEKDDFENKIAFNKVEDEIEDEGGRLW